MANGIDPTKCPATGKFHTRIQEMLDGWRKQDPATTKELPVEAEVPEYLVALSMVMTADEKDKAVADLREVTEILKYVLWALSGDVTTIIETTKIAPQTARQQYLLQAGGIGA